MAGSITCLVSSSTREPDSKLKLIPSELLAEYVLTVASKPFLGIPLLEEKYILILSLPNTVSVGSKGLDNLKVNH
jgi:hypothetical protein